MSNDNPQTTPFKFGDRVINIYASERNPQRLGIFVRAKMKDGVVNAGRWFQLTDGKDCFWEVDPDAIRHACSCLSCDPKTGEIGLECNKETDNRCLIFGKDHSNLPCDERFIQPPELSEYGEKFMREELLRRTRSFPKGWKLVPIEPTADMINAATEYADGYNRAYYNGLYKAMITSSPEAPCLNQ